LTKIGLHKEKLVLRYSGRLLSYREPRVASDMPIVVKNLTYNKTLRLRVNKFDNVESLKVSGQSG
jgi:hypothetical protein